MSFHTVLFNKEHEHRGTEHYCLPGIQHSFSCPACLTTATPRLFPGSAHQTITVRGFRQGWGMGQPGSAGPLRLHISAPHNIFRGLIRRHREPSPLVNWAIPSIQTLFSPLFKPYGGGWGAGKVITSCVISWVDQMAENTRALESDFLYM